MEGRDSTSLVSLWSLGSSSRERGNPLGHSGVAGAEGAAQGAVEQGRGFSALPASHGALASASRPVCADLTALTSCLCLLVLAPVLQEPLLSLPTLLPRSHAASEGTLLVLVLVVGFWPSCCGKSTCYHSAGVSKH